MAIRKSLEWSSHLNSNGVAQRNNFKTNQIKSKGNEVHQARDHS